MNQWTILVITMPFAFSIAQHGHAQDSAARTSTASEKLPAIDELLLFFPSKYPAGDWQPRGLRFEDIYFSADDGTKLHGWFCPCDNPRGVLLIAHGNAGHIASRGPWLQYLQSTAKLSVFMFDYRGYGRSEGTPTVEGTIRDAIAARAKLRELASVEDDEMLLMGESLGGAIMIHLAAVSAPRGLILQSTFSSLRDIADVHFPNLSWLVPPDKLNSVARITRYHGPVFQSHGTLDRTIPLSLGKKLFDAANEPRRFIPIAGADHNDWLTDTYLQHFNEFVDSVNRPSIPQPKTQEPEIAKPEKSARLDLILAVAVICSFVLMLAILVMRKKNAET